MRAFVRLLLLFAVAAPARADVTLHYAPDGPGSTNRLVVEADDHGNARVEANSSLFLLIRDGETYVVRDTPNGAAVARLSDVLAILAESRAQRGGMAGFRATREHFTITPHGTERVGEWNGMRYDLEAVPRAAAHSARALVVSSDPALARLAPVMEQVLAVQQQLFQAALGMDPDPAGDRQMHELLGRGLLLRSSDFVRLESMTTRPLSPDRLALPGPVLSRDQVRALSSHHD
jgi:hypothetical protein